MTRKAYLAIDLGAESGRAILGLLDHGKLSFQEVHRFLHLPQHLPDGLHWNLVDLWANILTGMRKAAETAKAQGLRITSVGVDTWGVDCALIGKSGQVLGLPFAYRDERNYPAMNKAFDALGKWPIYQATGCQFMPFNTLYQLVAQRDSEPALLDIASHLLFMPDLLHYFMTGKPVVETTIASTSQMIDPRTGDWALELCQSLGLPTAPLGRIIPAGTPIGALLPRVAAETGLAPDTQVIAPATHDTASAVAAVPADPATRWCFISSGTWSLMGAELPAPVLTQAAMEAPFTNEGGVEKTIRFLKNIAGLWLVQECRRYYEKAGQNYDYPTLTRLAFQAEPAFRTLLNTEHKEFALPGRMPEKIADYARATNQPVPEEPGQFIRACLESLALTYRRTLEKLQVVLGRQFDVIHIVGGGGHNDLLNQMTADATNRRVVVGPNEATAIGNLLTQAMGAGDVRDLADIRSIVCASFQPRVFEPAHREGWDDAYERFTKLMA